MMDKTTIYAQLNDIFREVFDDDDMAVSPEMTAADVPEWDSFNHVNIIVASEMKFGVKFKTGEIDSLRNVGDFAELIGQKLAA